MPHSRIWLLFVLLLASAFSRPHQQALDPTLTLTVTAGYSGLFREDQWFPLQITAQNDGADIIGQVVVRPETSGNVVANTFSTPLDLPAGSQKTVALYITARSYATEVRVEFLDADGQAVTTVTVPLRRVPQSDQLHIVLSESSAGTVDLTSIHAGGFDAWQAQWRIADMPDDVMALQAVNTILFADIDTGPLSLTQRDALHDWVLGGGHLLVAGGLNWQATAAGLEPLLPLIPNGAATTHALGALVALTAERPALDDSETTISTGALVDEAQVLAQTDDGQPLIVRHTLGLGTVDYVAFDPLAEPLRSWPGLRDVWFMLAAGRAPQPAWAGGLADADRAATAAEILPGFNLLPDILPLCGFLALYIALIGPLNYVVLNRINRREYAWVTIPLLIVLFSVAAWRFGFNLRGNSVTLSRLAVVEVWPEQAQAQVQGVVGVLSPRRSSYTLALADDMWFKPLQRSAAGNVFAASAQAGTTIMQAGVNWVADFMVDASFMALFDVAGTMPAPSISGQATLFYETAAADASMHWSLRGSVRNDSAVTLHDAVILARGARLALDTPLAPGQVVPFDLALLNESNLPASPAPLEQYTGSTLNRVSFSRFGSNALVSEPTVADILGDAYNTRLNAVRVEQNTAGQALLRRQMLLDALLPETYLTTGRGDRVFLVGWTNEAMPLETMLQDAVWSAVDTTLYIVELTVTQQLPPGRVHVGADQFNWVALERSGLMLDTAPVETTIQVGSPAVFQFTPLDGAVLDEVDRVYINLLATGTLPALLPVEVWNWDQQQWDKRSLERGDDAYSQRYLMLDQPRAYLGPQNTVRLRLTADDAGGAVRINRLLLEMDGTF